MPWHLSSIFSRARRTTTRRSEPSSQDTAPQSDPSVKQLPIDRKILQDPSSLLNDETLDVFPLSLTPSRRLPFADGSNHVHSRYRATPRPLPRLSELPGSPDVSPRESSRLAMSKIAAGGEWSTFGRKREHRAPGVAGLSGSTSPVDNPKSDSHSPSPPRDDNHPSADSNQSTFTLSRLTNPSRADIYTPERHSSLSINSAPSPDMHFSSKPSSPADTTSSKRDPRTPQRISSYTALTTAYTTCSVISLTTPTNRELAFDSPHTFGHPTPPDNPVDFSVAYPPTPPPLPPLDHPELAAASSRTRSMSTGQPALSAFRDRSNTLPTNRRALRRDDLFPSLSLRLEHSIRHQSSLPQARQGFDGAKEETQDLQGRRRARTISTGVRRRRTSADWSAYQATVGVNSHANQAWPAEVSREILRLSLGGPDHIPGSPGNYADPDRRPDTSFSRSFLPFPHPSRPSSPPPSTASATLEHGRETTPSRPRSLQAILGSRQGSQQLGRIAMAEVKRSLSAIETRNGRRSDASGAAYTSLGLNGPASGSSKASHASPLLHPSSTFAPSQSLPSGRVSPNTMSSSLQIEPSTPTPAPRHLSDKSRGKRKAEDNLDLTPPEQKKEGQRATFLLPSESRGQRISNSSHAPSSYHRKRARLSSTSPFATPVQSRPASVQETPKTRSHPFASLSSSTGGHLAPSRTPSRAASSRSRPPHTPSTTRKHERHQSMSQVSIPISAIVSPHAPSISRSTKFHMRDPRRPPKKPNDTPWRLEFATEDEPGSPLQAWFFFFGFLLFPIWWVAGFLLRVPTTRIAGDVATEKGVPIDDPQIEHDARTWRFRCRVLAVVSLFTYIPFIVLVAIFAPR